MEEQNEIQNKILQYLNELSRNDQIGASVLDISKKIKHNRITVSKYLEIMKAQGILEAKTIAQAKIYTVPKTANKPTILVVDDEPHIVDLIKLSLDTEKYNFIEAFSGIDALEKVFTKLPDLVILDLMMPGMDGFEVCERLKNNEITKNIPVLILSAKTEMADKMQGVESGADEYITKPFDPAELESQVRLLISDNTPHIEKNPITNLPAKKLLINEINNRLSEGENFDMYIISIDNMKNINTRVSHRTGADILHIFGNFLTMKFSGDYISHIDLNNFVILTNKKLASFKSLEEEYTKFLPFIYSEKNIIHDPKKKDYAPKLEIKHIPYKDFHDQRGRLEQILV